MSDIELLAQKLDAYIKHNDEYHIKQDDERKDMAQKIDEMHQVFTATGIVGKAIKWIATFIIAIGSAYLLIKQIITNN